MTTPVIPVGATWLPSEYLDETAPPCRSTPGQWLTGSAADGWRLCAPRDGDDERALSEGELVNFHAMVDIANVTLVVAFDEGRLWHTDPPGPFTAPPGFSLSVYDGETTHPDIDSAAYELDCGEHDIEIYAWSDTPVSFRFTEGRFELARQDG